MRPPTVVLVAVTLQSQQGLGSPQPWVRSMEGFAKEPHFWCETALVQTVNTDSFRKGQAGALVVFWEFWKWGTGMTCVALACHLGSSILQHLGLAPAGTALTDSSLLSFPVSRRTTSRCPTSQTPAATPPLPPPPHLPRRPHRCRPARHPRPRCTPPRSAHASRSSSTCQVP